MARDLDGVNQYFSAVAGEFGDEDFTIVARILFDSLAADANLFARWKTSTGRGYRCRYDTGLGYITWGVFDGSSETTVEAGTYGIVGTGDFLPIVCWHDATGNEIGINLGGLEDTTSHSTGVGANATAAFRVGTDTNLTDFLDGAAAEVAIFAGLLDADQRAAYIAGHSPDLIAPELLTDYWKFLRGEIRQSLPWGRNYWGDQDMVSVNSPGIRYGHPPMIYPGGVRTTIFAGATIASDAPAYVAALLSQPRRPRHVEHPRRRPTEFSPPYVEEAQGAILIESPPARRPRRLHRVRRRGPEFAPPWPPIPGVLDVCGGTAHLVTRRPGSAALLSATVGGAAATNGTAAAVSSTPGTAKRVEC